MCSSGSLTGGADATYLAWLVLDGLFVSGGDIVLRGFFDTVSLVCATLDPGNAGAKPGTYAKAVDGRDLIPCHLWTEGSVKSLTIDRSIGRRPDPDPRRWRNRDANTHEFHRAGGGSPIRAGIGHR